MKPWQASVFSEMCTRESNEQGVMGGPGSAFYSYDILTGFLDVKS